MIGTLRAHAAPGDAVLFGGARCGLIATAFQEEFQGRPDLGAARSAAEAAALDSLPADPALLRQRLARAPRVWHITCTHLSAGAGREGARTAESQDRALAGAGFTPAYHRTVRGITLTLEHRTTPAVASTG